MGKRSKRVWQIKFEAVVDMLNIMDNYEKTDKIESTCTMLRNPIVFDNNLKEVKTFIPYTLKGYKNETTDHLIGMSNMVLYIVKKGLHKKWETVDDFKKTLRALNVLIPVSKYLNNEKTWKKGWLFDYENIEGCIKWSNKLKSVGITSIVCNETGEDTDVDIVWEKWYNNNKEYLN